MRTFVILLLVLILCVLAFGLWRGWFVFTGPERADDGNRINVQLSVDQDQVEADAARALDEAKLLSGQGKEAGR